VKIQYSNFLPSSIFLWVVVIVLLIPGLMVAVSGYQENLRVIVSYQVYNDAAYQNLYACCLMVISFLLGKYNFFVQGKFKRLYRRQPYILSRYDYEQPFLYLLCTFSVAFFVYYIAMNGFGKVFSLGSAVTMAEFRLSGSFDEIARSDKALLQISRRLFLPFVVIALIVRRRFSRCDNSILFYVACIIFPASVLITLDRGPLLMMFLLPIFVTVSFVKSPLNYLARKTPVLLLAIIAIGGAMTYLQYNVLDVGFEQIMSSGFYFLWHRVFAAPTIASIELSFITFPAFEDYLFLKYSRLGALFGGVYVGTNTDTSIFVTPVGFVGDIWRNFGYFGILFVSFILGIIFQFLDKNSMKLSSPMAIALNFTILTLTFYLTNGLIFSQGVMIQLLFVIFVVFFFSRKIIVRR
jgi:oligosaccharide repeat unit polymerase